ncbi:MAG: hypothetical protein FWF57_00345 [Defluviitaleaceae bacterium]|nr:hypothetical protein [Defluviitaleaceae bacterium]
MDKSLRDELMDEVFSLGENYRLDNISKLKVKLSNYLKENPLDRQVGDALIFLKIYREEAKGNDFKLLCKIAKPILNRITNTDIWCIRDIEILSLTFCYTETYEQSILLFKQAFAELRKYENRKNYYKYIINIKSCFFINLLLIFQRENVYLDETSCTFKSQKLELELLFKKTFDDAIYFFNKNHFHIHKIVAYIRRGIFYDDMLGKILIIICLNKLKEKNEELYMIMLREVDKYNIKYEDW